MKINFFSWKYSRIPSTFLVHLVLFISCQTLEIYFLQLNILGVICTPELSTVLCTKELGMPKCSPYVFSHFSICLVYLLCEMAVAFKVPASSLSPSSLLQQSSALCIRNSVALPLGSISKQALQMTFLS